MGEAAMITSAAVRAKINNKTMIIPCHRHSNFFEIMKKLECNYDMESVEQGFLDWDRESKTVTFVDRRRAFEIARACGQVAKERPLQPLYTEDLW